MAEKYVSLVNQIRNLYHLTESDVSVETMETLWENVIETYSQFRGIRDCRVITQVADQNQYELQDAEWYITDVFWNATHPSNVYLVMETQTAIEEKFHHPSLALIDSLKRRLLEKNVSIEHQEWFETWDETNSKRVIELHPIPETEIILVFRKLYNKISFPQSDSKLIGKLLEAEVLQYMLGCGQMATVGDVTFDTNGMRAEIKRLRRQFFTTMQTVKGGRS